jgi:ABC-type dipeptide/oligopeptide/nickel transport system permease component
MILPWIAVAAGQAAVTARLTRAGILEVLGEDYVRTAWGKGLAERRIVWFHVLRAAILPVVSSVGVGFAVILGRRPSSTRCSRSAGSGRRSWWQPKPGT